MRGVPVPGDAVPGGAVQGGVEGAWYVSSAVRDPSASRVPTRRPGRPPSTSLGALVDAAISIGLDRFTLAGVGELVDVAESTVYGYVENRDALFAAACSSLLERLDPHIDAATWTDYVDRAAGQILELADAHPGLAPYVLYGPYTESTISFFDAMIDAVRGFLPGIDDNLAWVLASRPVTAGLVYLGDPVLAPMAGWLRRSFLAGMDAQLQAGELPPSVGTPWRTRLHRR